ncbi:MAG: 2-oxoglutarate and iron-dependent oxygenase domain-containing protein [Myxococcota bacterium]
MSVPIVDMADYWSGSPQRVAREVGRAFEEHGFLTLVGHRVPMDLIQQTEQVLRDFFVQSEDEKREVLSRPEQGKFCGYVPFAADSAARQTDADAPMDLRARYRAVCSDAESVRAYVGPNQWPRYPAAFEKTLQSYAAAMKTLSDHVIRLCANALHLGDDGLARHFDDDFSVTMAAYSPRELSSPQPGQMRCGEHHDIGALTFVSARAGRNGLQVVSDGKWQDVEFPPDAFAVNIGDLLARWTNDVWVSTKHRVTMPQDMTKDRISLVYFNQPSLDVPIEVLPTCISSGQAAKYPPTTLREHFHRQQNKGRRNYDEQEAKS